MMFSRNVTDGMQNEIMSMWSVSNVQQYEKYIGLPLVIGRSKSQVFSKIKQKVWQKL